MEREDTWPLVTMAVAAIVGATVTAWSTSSVPHDLIGIAIAVAGYLMGHRGGVLTERLHSALRELKSVNGHKSEGIRKGG